MHLKSWPPACKIYTVSELGTEPSTRSKKKRESAVHCLALHLIIDLLPVFRHSLSVSQSQSQFHSHSLSVSLSLFDAVSLSLALPLLPAVYVHLSVRLNILVSPPCETA